MTDLPYTLDHPEPISARSLTVDHGRISISDALEALEIPLYHLTANGSARLARAMLAAAGTTGHEVVNIEDYARAIRIREAVAAEDMRERAVATAEADEAREWSRLETTADRIHDLPLLDGEGDEEVPQPNYADTPAGRRVIEKATLDVLDKALRDSPPAPDYRVPLVAEALGEDREDAADMLAEDPAGTWERVYVIWSMDRGRLDEYRRGEGPALGRVAQLERDMGRVVKRLAKTENALELAARETHQSGGAPRAQVAGGSTPQHCPVTAYNDMAFLDMVCHHDQGHLSPHYNPADGGWQWDNDGNVTALDGASPKGGS